MRWFGRIVGAVILAVPPRAAWRLGSSPSSYASRWTSRVGPHQRSCAVPATTIRCGARTPGDDDEQRTPWDGLHTVTDGARRRLGHSEDEAEALAERLRGKTILAPLTRGGTPPFRALCIKKGAEATMGEMAFARNVLKGDAPERARLRKHRSETLFGAQIATNDIAQGVAACERAAAEGASWVDLNAGCPIYEATRRGLGSALLRKPAKIARLVRGLVDGSPVPVSVKLRTSSAGEKDVNFLQVLDALREESTSQPAFVTLHARTAMARYTKPADWSAIDEACGRFPRVVGNGDVLTWYEARRRRELAPDMHALMVGRGALITPWLFDEINTESTWLPTAEERVDVYWQLSRLFQRHFGDDARGKHKAWYFFPWHFNFLSRWRPLPAAVFEPLAAEHPLLQSGRKVEQLLKDTVEGPPQELPPLERLLRCPVDTAHFAIADLLWDAATSKDAVRDLERLASVDRLRAWDREATATSVDAKRRDLDANEGFRASKSKRGPKAEEDEDAAAEASAHAVASDDDDGAEAPPTSSSSVEGREAPPPPALRPSLSLAGLGVELQPRSARPAPAGDESSRSAAEDAGAPASSS